MRAIKAPQDEFLENILSSLGNSLAPLRNILLSSEKSWFLGNIFSPLGIFSGPSGIFFAVEWRGGRMVNYGKGAI